VCREKNEDKRRVNIIGERERKNDFIKKKENIKGKNKRINKII